MSGDPCKTGPPKKNHNSEILRAPASTTDASYQVEGVSRRPKALGVKIGTVVQELASDSGSGPENQDLNSFPRAAVWVFGAEREAQSDPIRRIPGFSNPRPTIATEPLFSRQKLLCRRGPAHRQATMLARLSLLGWCSVRPETKPVSQARPPRSRRLQPELDNRWPRPQITSKRWHCPLEYGTRPRESNHTE